jgi:hypothetical protein
VRSKAGLLYPKPVVADVEEFNVNESPLTTTDGRGLTWQSYGSAVFAASGGLAGATTAPAAWGGNGDICTVDEGTANGTLVALVNNANLGNSKGAGIAFRVGPYTAVNGYFAMIDKNSSGIAGLYIQRYDNGALTSVYGAGSTAYGATSVRMLRVVMAGTAVTVEVRTSDGLTVIDTQTITDSNHSTRTRHGIMSYNNSTALAVDRWQFTG